MNNIKLRFRLLFDFVENQFFDDFPFGVGFGKGFDIGLHSLSVYLELYFVFHVASILKKIWLAGLEPAKIRVRGRIGTNSAYHII